MDKSFYEMIFKRKSFHIFINVGNESISRAELDEIQNAYTTFIPLNPDIKTTIRIVPEKQTNFDVLPRINPWDSHLDSPDST